MTKKPKIVLIIDDTEFVLHHIARMADRLGIQTILMRDSTEFKANQIKNDVDLVLTDIFMPGKNGLEIIFEVQEEASALPVVAMSAGFDGHKNRDPALRAAVKLGARTVLQKPLSFDRFESAMRDLDLVA